MFFSHPLTWSRDPLSPMSMPPSGLSVFLAISRSMALSPMAHSRTLVYVAVWGLSNFMSPSDALCRNKSMLLYIIKIFYLYIWDTVSVYEDNFLFFVVTIYYFSGADKKFWFWKALSWPGRTMSSNVYKKRDRFYIIMSMILYIRGILVDFFLLVPVP